MVNPIIKQENLKNLVTKERIKWLFVLNICLSIFLLLSVVIYTDYWNSRSFFQHLLRSAIAGFSIGTLVTLSIVVSNISAVSTPWKRFFGFSLIVLLSTWIGVFVHWGVRIFFLGDNFSFELEMLKGVDLEMVILGNSVVFVMIGGAVYVYFSLRQKWDSAVKKIASMEVNEEKLHRLKTKAELEALQAKVNPHFLFNTINSVIRLIRVDPDRADTMLRQLSDLFRYNLDASNHEKIKLQDEITIIRKYLEIEKVRLGKRLSYQIDVEESLGNLEIPGLLLQPLVENSIKHGISPQKSGGEVAIKAWKNGDFCHIEISDTGCGFSKLEASRGFGLSGVEERLALCYGNDYELTINSENGVLIQLKLPLRQAQ